MSGTPKETLREIRYTLLWAIGIALAFLFVWHAWELLFLAFAGFLLAIMLRALTDWVQTHTRLGPNLSFAATVCGLVVLAGLAAWFVIPNVISQAIQIIHVVPKSLTEVRRSLDHWSWGRYLVKLASRSMNNVNFGAPVTHIARSLLNAISALFVVAVVGFYAALNPVGYANGLLRLVPEERREAAREVASEIVYTLRWWMLGQLVPMVVLGAVTMIGLWALGVPLAFTLGLLTGVMIFIPYFGALLSEIPALLVALNRSPRTMVYVLILYLGVHVLEGYILTPLVQKRAVRLLPIVTILSQFLMWILTGFLGVAIATPLAAVALVLIKKLYLREKIRHRPDFGV